MSIINDFKYYGLRVKCENEIESKIFVDICLLHEISNGITHRENPSYVSCHSKHENTCFMCKKDIWNWHNGEVMYDLKWDYIKLYENYKIILFKDFYFSYYGKEFSNQNYLKAFKNHDIRIECSNICEFNNFIDFCKSLGILKAEHVDFNNNYCYYYVDKHGYINIGDNFLDMGNYSVPPKMRGLDFIELIQESGN